MKILVIIGTRPEAIKLAPLVRLGKATTGLEVVVCFTAQHRQMLDQVVELYQISPDYDLNLMKENQSLTTLTSGVLSGVTEVIASSRPDMVVVQGDTTTTMASALAAFYERIPVAHVEAGLRTGDIYSPWPEEVNRRISTSIASLHFAPTVLSKQNLLNEGIPEKYIVVTGNTGIDSLFTISEMIDQRHDISAALDNTFSFLGDDRKNILVTMHRRENFGGCFEDACNAIKQIAWRKDVRILYPVHMNPHVREPVTRILSGIENVYLLPPLDYLPFVYLMKKAFMLITDSGGVQEEAPSLGKPVIVTRKNTERPEAIEAGTVVLAGTDTERIVTEASLLLDNREAYARMSMAHNPYGDGKACERIIKELLAWHR
ncbi:non-hydrolyzing UDP-N-acetylglucosamine 2-epimerase [Thiovibrio sp. JS02]